MRYTTDDNCAICWEPMEVALILPCSHIFHAPCLRSWLEQDTTCPTCRFVCVSQLWQIGKSSLKVHMFPHD